jgi:hypothetical protein
MAGQVRIAGRIPEALTPAERDRMKTLLREFWGSWHTWVFFVSLLAALSGIIGLASYVQRTDTRRQLDANSARSLERIKAELQVIKIQNENSIRDRNALHATVDKIKSQVKDKADSPKKWIRETVEKIKEEIKDNADEKARGKGDK